MNLMKRSVIPTDSALAFINYLLEDFGDEWCTKYMFHYRWHEKKMQTMLKDFYLLE